MFRSRGKNNNIIDSSNGSTGLVTAHDYMVQTVCHHAFAKDPEFERFSGGHSEISEDRTLDYYFATRDDPHDPQSVFHKLRWGGQFVFATRSGREAVRLCRQFKAYGFVIERGPDRIHRWLLHIPIIPVGPKIYYFVARKVLLLPPGDTSGRFTYDVHLERSGNRYIVVKQLPKVETIIRQLCARNSRMEEDPTLEVRAAKLVSDVLPIFLTRETRFLHNLQRELPEEFRTRIPRPLAVERDANGNVKRLALNWLRKTTKTMSQIDFAIQSAELLHAIHMIARLIHFDLRLDNFVITDDGVGFVDFGSAARAGENIAADPVLHKLFGQLLHTSQVQKLIKHMANHGSLTSCFLTRALRKVDRAADLFMLTLQIERPDTNPYTRELVLYEEGTSEARMISELRKEVMLPPEPLRPTYTSVRELLRTLLEIKERLS